MGELPETSSEDETNLKNESQKVIDLLKQPLKVDDKWYVLEKHWYKQWKEFADSCNSNHHPGPINNSEILLDGSDDDLKEHLLEELDYYLVPEEAWEILLGHYGIMENQKPIKRKVIEEGRFITTKVVEVYPIPLKLCKYPNTEKTVVKKFSRILTIGDLDKEMRALFQVPEKNETRIWNAYVKNDYQKMDKDNTVQSCSLQKDQLVIIETKKPNEEWKITTNNKKSNNSFQNGNSYKTSQSSGTGFFSSTSCSSNYQLRNTSYSDNYKKNKLTPGLCGLNNLGNTCFMNSALQCLSNVPSLTNYFKENKYHKELNVNNPLGMHGKIATTYANLIRSMWSGDHSSVAPREFKYAVGQFQPRFVGYQQQDSQELMAFLIDGLHEDLNRISNKPYIEIKDADGRPLELVAQEAWDNHRKRNDSVIVDTLHGLFRSIVDCPECPRISVTFDPFCYLTLPLPVKKDKSMECTFVPKDSTEDMVKYKVTVPKSGLIDDLCKAVAVYNEKPSNDMVVTDVYNNRFHKIFSAHDPIRHIYDKDVIYIFEAPHIAIMLPVYLRWVSENGGCMLFGQPLLIPVQGNSVTYLQMYRDILRSILRFLVDDGLKGMIRDFLSLDEEQALAEMKDLCNPSEEPGEEARHDLFNLFTMKSVNAFGTHEFKRFDFNDDKPIKVSDGMHIATDWNRKSCEKYFTKRWAEMIVEHESMRPTVAKKANCVNLSNCMELFTSKEQLGKDNTWYCSKCKKHQQAYKKLDLWMLPPILIIHLKRFSNNRFSRDKLDTFVDFSQRDLDLSDFVVNPNKDKLPENQRRYNLIAVSNHYGGLGGGHYTAFAKNHVDKQWHYFDDSSVSLSSEDRVVTKAAYMLVYQRQDLEEWLEDKSGQPFPFLEPIFSPRAMDIDSDLNGASFQFRQSQDEDILNNNNTEDAMDTS